MQKCCLNPSGICCEDCIHEQLYCDNADVTAYKRNFTTEQLQDSGGGILLAHISNSLQQESMDIYTRWCVRRTVRDSSHPRHGLLSPLPSGRCYRRTFTSRLQDKFFPQAIRLN